jgi:hypothetical protein
VGPLGFFVLIFAEVHQTANRRLRHRCDLYQITTRFFRRFQRSTQSDDADLLTVLTRQTHFRHTDFAVNAQFFILSDGSILQELKKY